MKTPWTGTARAKMNGSGNLNVRCESTNAAGAWLELSFGNASFDGPRTYLADDFSSDGSVRYQTSPAAPFSWDSSSDGSSCALVLTEAPVDARGSSVPRGSRIAGSFSCTTLNNSDPKSMPSIAIESGTLVATVE